MHDEATVGYKKRVATLYAEWKADPHAFAEAHPHITISISMGSDPRACAMRSIAEYVMSENIRFAWIIVEFLGSDPEFVITTAA